MSDSLFAVGALGLFALMVLGMFGGFIALVVFIARRAAAEERQRQQILQQFAASRGWRFTPGPTTLGDEVRRLKLFGLGRSQRWTNAVRGESKGHDVALVDFKYTTGGSKNSTAHHQTVCAVRVAGAALPHVYLRPQLGLFDALGRMLGGQDFDFPEDPAFSEAFVAQTSGSESELRRLLTPNVRARVLVLAQRSPLVEVSGEYVLLHFGAILDGVELDGLIDSTVGLAQLLAAEGLASGAGLASR